MQVGFRNTGADHGALILLLALVSLTVVMAQRQVAKDDLPPPAPFVRNPIYNPYAAYGEANATGSRQPSIVTDHREARRTILPERPATNNGRPGRRGIGRQPERPARTS